MPTYVLDAAEHQQLRILHSAQLSPGSLRDSMRRRLSPRSSHGAQRKEVYDIPKPIQHKQLRLVSREPNLVNRIVHQLHLRIEHRVDALKVQQIAFLQRDNIIRVIGWGMVGIDVLRQHRLVVFELGRSHAG
jgi:hypothetical protein